MLTQDDFYAKAEKFALLKDTDSHYYTFEEYNTLIKDNQTDKDGNLIYLYANNTDEQYTYIAAAKDKGYNVLLMDGQLDVPMINKLEQKLEKSRFTRVDSDVIDRLIVKDEQKGEKLPQDKQEILSTVFNGQLPKLNKTEFHVEVEPLGETAAPVIITQSEYMRRMKDMASIQPGMSFYGEMPDMFSMVLNSDHKLVKQVLDDAESACAEKLVPVESEIAMLKLRETELHKAHEGKKDEEIPTTEKDELKDVEQKLTEQKQQKDAIVNEYAASNKIVHQLIDLALLQNNMLKGEALNNFVKRSVELI